MTRQEKWPWIIIIFFLALGGLVLTVGFFYFLVGYLTLSYAMPQNCTVVEHEFYNSLNTCGKGVVPCLLVMVRMGEEVVYDTTCCVRDLSVVKCYDSFGTKYVFEEKKKEAVSHHGQITFILGLSGVIFASMVAVVGWAGWKAQ